MTRIAVRKTDPAIVERLVRQGMHPTLARIYAARGISDQAELSIELGGLLPPSSLLHIDAAARLLEEAIGQNRKICVVADYDCDGATACAVAVLGLSMMGAKVTYLVPNRFEDGYGLTPAIVQTVHETHAADVIVTVDNGIASHEGVREAVSRGMEVLVTDHHLPGDSLPESCVIVNPNQPGCGFESKHLAGVGVIFYILLSLRKRLREQDVFDRETQPRLDTLLDLVALGTIADVVPLDRNNRILVAQGIKRIQAGRMRPGMRALFRTAQRSWQEAGTFDLAYIIGPRLNAAGRMSDMSIGIECLLAEDEGKAWEMAESLNRFNQERRDRENEMQDEALAMLETFEAGNQASISVLDPGWHGGIVGILASRLKERFFRPVIAFAHDKDGCIRGSGRSIPGFHLRDALDLVSKRYPEMITRFGGHAMAAGLTMPASAYDDFCAAFEAVAREQLREEDLLRVVETDGPPEDSCYSLDFVRELNTLVWGQGFDIPAFSDVFRIISQRIVKERHLSLRLETNGKQFSGIFFGRNEFIPEKARLAFRLNINTYNGISSVQLVVMHAEAV